LHIQKRVIIIAYTKFKDMKKSILLIALTLTSHFATIAGEAKVKRTETATHIRITTPPNISQAIEMIEKLYPSAEIKKEKNSLWHSGKGAKGEKINLIQGNKSVTIIIRK
jgi:hypothetical protein